VQKSSRRYLFDKSLDGDDFEKLNQISAKEEIEAGALENARINQLTETEQEQLPINASKVRF